VGATIYPGNALPAVPVNLNVVRAEVARLFRAWKAHGRLDDTEQARLLGLVLYRSVLPDPVGQELESRISDSNNLVNLSLHFAEGIDPDLKHLPWEQLHTPDRKTDAGVPIGAHSQLSLTRVLSPKPAATSESTKSTLSVLLVQAPESEPVANSVGHATVANSLVNMFAENSPGPVTVTEAKKVDQDKLVDKVVELAPDVLHYVGHSRYRGTAEEADELAIAGDDEIAYLAAKLFADCLAQRPPRLVVLQACLGPEQVPGDLTMLAPRLLMVKVEAVVALQFPLSDLEHASKFNRLFYQELAEGGSIRNAVQRGRVAVRLRNPWALPALFQRQPGDIRLVLPPSSSRSSDVQTVWGGSRG
jgi:hypothetical protein